VLVVLVLHQNMLVETAQAVESSLHGHKYLKG
jgi:hypothetical protein